MGRILDYFLSDGDWSKYQQIRTMKKARELMDSKINEHPQQPTLNIPIKPIKQGINKCLKCKNGKMIINIKQGVYEAGKPSPIGNRKILSIFGLANKTEYTSFCPVCGHTIKKTI